MCTRIPDRVLNDVRQYRKILEKQTGHTVLRHFRNGAHELPQTGTGRNITSTKSRSTPSHCDERLVFFRFIATIPVVSHDLSEKPHLYAAGSSIAQVMIAVDKLIERLSGFVID